MRQGPAGVSIIEPFAVGFRVMNNGAVLLAPSEKHF
jgi:hypothetical protein